ncbi:hypothetical protein C8F04DRAFT_37156 [Mycena alexandri]|uniref:Uncharacterized protein n=1 Tax=Mycena alexandri TaxID=1745969 RepID=A0AAD6XB27_9AGAR|nr:hypothetical protein C8F04DRAFT_37156 [Mycena alexandri]
MRAQLVSRIHALAVSTFPWSQILALPAKRLKSPSKRSDRAALGSVWPTGTTCNHPVVPLIQINLIRKDPRLLCRLEIVSQQWSSFSSAPRVRLLRHLDDILDGYAFMALRVATVPIASPMENPSWSRRVRRLSKPGSSYLHTW